MKSIECMPAGVVLERRKIDNPWQDYDDTEDDVVGGVPMPDQVIARVQDFVDEHHVDVPFKKRKREPYDPRKGGFARNPGRGGRHG